MLMTPTQQRFHKSRLVKVYSVFGSLQPFYLTSCGHWATLQDRLTSTAYVEKMDGGIVTFLRVRNRKMKHYVEFWKTYDAVYKYLTWRGHDSRFTNREQIH